MNNKILIFGKGYIGERLKEALGCNISEKRILSYNDALKETEKFNPKIIINSIGHTGLKNVDGCELAIDKTLSSNTFIPIILAELALRKKIKLVHISSGCTYHYDYFKNKPLAEKDKPDFFELFYSRSKIYSEEALLPIACKYKILITRIRIPLDNRTHPRNILNKLVAYKKIINVPNSVTYLPDFIEALKHLIKIDASGIYNVVNKGGLRYPELLDIYKKFMPDFEYKIIDYKKLNLVRTNLILSVKKLENTGFKVRHISEVLEECVQNYLNY